MHTNHTFNTASKHPIVTKSTKTTVREFDIEERCVKETVTEVTETTHYQYSPNPTWYTTSGNATHIKNASASYDGGQV